MPRKLFDDEGAEIEVPTEDELKDLQEKAKKAETVDELQKVIKELNIPEGIKLPDYVKQLKEESNPNWKKNQGFDCKS